MKSWLTKEIHLQPDSLNELPRARHFYWGVHLCLMTCWGGRTAFVLNRLAFNGDEGNFSIYQSALQPISCALHTAILSSAIEIHLISSEISTCQRKGTMFPSIYDGRGKSNLHLYVDCPLLPCSLYKQPGVCKRKTLSLIYNISVSDWVFTGWQITNSRQQNTNT